jgi:hypothetical protein
MNDINPVSKFLTIITSFRNKQFDIFKIRFNSLSCEDRHKFVDFVDIVRNTKEEKSELLNWVYKINRENKRRDI